MKFSSLTPGAGSPVDAKSDILAVPVFEDVLAENETFSEIDRRLDGLVARLAEEEQFKGKKGQSLSLHTHGKIGAQRVLILGAGSRGDFDTADVRHLAARAVRAARPTNAKSLTFVLPAGDERAVQLAVEGTLLGRYRFDRYFSSEDSKRPDVLATISFAGAQAAGDSFGKAVTRGETIAAAVMRARDYINEPASEMTPRRLADEAQKIASQHGMEVKVLGPKECRELGMGMYLAVAQGSDEEPRFIHMTYKPKTGKAKKRIVLVGKGVTFDSGGLSLKPSNAMEDMKVDMSGAAAVISSIGAIAALGLPVEVHALAACAENMPSGKSYKLGDVLRSMNGKTVEINNTDAEGRLTLGDALTYGLRLEPDEIFDFATLTGACVVALGPYVAGVITNNKDLSERWLAAAKAAGEDMWPLPLPERLKEMLKSDVADMRNTGERFGGALTAGLFLREFVGKVPWVHVDLAGPAHTSKEYGAAGKGGTGFAVSTILEYLSRV